MSCNVELEEKRMEATFNAVKHYYEYHPLELTKSDDEYTLATSSDKRWKLFDQYLASSDSAHLERYWTS
ncbi:unnamed protein product [Peronospora effusa]|uniref:Uncharacterized protein n=1 Tax=Peronospora effusa TaxID=542832 RepID=A0A3M6VDQ1_9STRA|nr:hypothetical protein DD238_004193 [Peronospora effusa]CAI5719571.1 unnamed protein product [Peronospora effusa]